MTEPLCIKIAGAWTALPLRSTEEMVVNEEGISISYEALKGSVADQERLGAFRPDPLPAPPKGKVETARTLRPDGDRPAYDVTYGDAPEPGVPDGPTLSDWRVALIKMGRFVDVEAAVKEARDGGSADGLIAWQRFEYANNVYRAELLQLAPVMGFKPEDVDQSLTIAAQVAAAARQAA